MRNQCTFAQPVRLCAASALTCRQCAWHITQANAPEKNTSEKRTGESVREKSTDTVKLEPARLRLTLDFLLWRSCWLPNNRRICGKTGLDSRRRSTDGVHLEGNIPDIQTYDFQHQPNPTKISKIVWKRTSTKTVAKRVQSCSFSIIVSSYLSLGFPTLVCRLVYGRRLACWTLFWLNLTKVITLAQRLPFQQTLHCFVLNKVNNAFTDVHASINTLRFLCTILLHIAYPSRVHVRNSRTRHHIINDLSVVTPRRINRLWLCDLPQMVCVVVH